MTPSRRTAWILICLAWLSTGAMARVEAPESAGGFEERIDVEVLNIDVVVTDKKGRFVEGLTSDDFELRIDGQQVPIANFYSVTADARSPASRDPEPAGRPGTTVASAEPLMHVVVYLDNFYLTPASRKRVLRDLPGFFEAQTAVGARVMLVAHDRTIRMLTPFTTRAHELTAALESVKETTASGIHHRSAYSSVMRNLRDVYESCSTAGRDPCADCISQMIQMARFYSLGVLSERRGAMAALGSVANALSVLEGKKALLHVSDGIQQQTGVDIYFYLGDQLCPGQRQQLQEYYLRRDIADLDDLVSQANSSRVTLYTLEAAGLRNFSSASAEFNTSFFVPSPFIDQVRFSNLQGGLFYLAEETGGRSILNANQFAPELAALTDEFSTYYSLGYQPQHVGRGRPHRVSVQVEKRNHQVRYRRSILHKKPEQQLADRVMGAVMFELTENPLGAEVNAGEQSPTSEGRVKVSIDVAVPVERLTLVPHGGSRTGRLTVIVVAPDEKGKRTAVRKKEIAVELPAASAPLSEQLYRFGVNVELQAGRHVLGLSLWDELAAAGSFLSLSVEAQLPDPQETAQEKIQP